MRTGSSAAQIAGGVDPRQITLTFSRPITNGPGADLAAFENAFGRDGGVDLDAIAALHVVPEPGTLLLVGLGLAGLAIRRPS